MITGAGCTSRYLSRQGHPKQGGEGRYVFLRFFQILFRVSNGEIVKNIYRVFGACVRSFLRWALQGRELVELDIRPWSTVRLSKGLSVDEHAVALTNPVTLGGS